MNKWNQLPPDGTQQRLLIAEQIDMELHSLDLGVQRYHRIRRDRDSSRGTPEMRLIGSVVPAASAMIKRERESVLDKMGAGRGVAHWGYPLWSLDPDKLAVLALVTMINLCDASSGMAIICRRLGSIVEQEYRFEQFKTEHRKMYDVVSKRIKNWTPRQVRYMRNKVDLVERPWPLRVRHWVGFKLIECVLATSDVFIHRMIHITDKGRRKKRYLLEMRADIRAELETQHTNCEVLHPWYLPMLTPPNDWAPGEQGGYRYHRYPMVKPQNLLENPEEEREHGPIVYEAINALQVTGWRINRRVHEVMSAVWAAGGGYAGIPTSNPRVPANEVPIPDDCDDESLTQFKLARKLIHDDNARTIGKRKATLSKLRTSDRFSKYDEFFFPFQYDYRGRIYPVSTDLHPQSDDIARGLLEFSVGKPLGEDGLEWLMIRLANCFGIDKCSFKDRVDWVIDHATDVCLCAGDPLDFKWWTEADDPWQALATMFELWPILVDQMQEQVSGNRLKDHREFVSHLPGTADGTCNGLQHFAAMCLDPVAAKQVSLVPADKPDRIYTFVAERVYKRIEEDVQRIPDSEPTDKEGNPVAHPAFEWLMSGVSDKTVKRATMTLAYGVTPSGMQDQFVTDGWTEGMDRPRSAACYLRDVTWEVLGEIVTSAREIMDWLKDIARITSKKGHKLTWTSPAGFNMVQESLRTKDTAIYTLIQRVHMYIAEPGKISPYRQQLCMPPNFVHDMDAAHMMLTVDECVKRGVTSLNMIHDSYGTHFADMDTLHSALRYRFVRMYHTDWLRQYWKEWSKATGLDLPEPPSRGDFDLIQVIDSLYFFG